MIQIQVPDTGSIMGCWFPEKLDNNGRPIPGPNFRPCLLLQIIKRLDKQNIDLVLCYGTGQTTDCNKISKSSSFVEVEVGVLNTLKETTKFDLSKIFTLPFNSIYFSPKGQPDIPYKKYGKLSDIELEKVLSILEIKNYLEPKKGTTIIVKKSIK